MTTARRPSVVEQVRQGLLDDLVAGTLSTGDKLPNEDRIAERFGVSRATVREAVLGLIDAGYLTRRHGSGTFVTKGPRSRHALDTTVSYTAMIRDAGHQPGETVIAKAKREPTEDERELLGLEPGEPVLEVERVRFADHRPVIYSRDRIPAALLAGIADDRLDSSLYMILDAAGHPVARASAELLPTLADDRLSDLLEVECGTPLLHIDQVDYDARGRAVMLSLEWHVADAFELIVNRRAASGSADS